MTFDDLKQLLVELKEALKAKADRSEVVNEEYVEQKLKEVVEASWGPLQGARRSVIGHNLADHGLPDSRLASFPGDVKSLLEYPATKAHPDTFGIDVVDPEIAALQRAADEVTLVRAVGEAYHPSWYRGGIGSTKSYGKFRKAFEGFLDRTGEKVVTAGSSPVSDWVPTGFSDQLYTLLRLELRVASLFDQFTMPTDPFKWPSLTAGLAAYRIGENADISATSFPDSAGLIRDFSSGAITFNAEKIVVANRFTSEADEDSIIAVAPTVMREMARAFAEGLEAAILEGDASVAQHITDMHGNTWNTTYSPESAWDGLRALAIDKTADVSMGATLLATEATTKLKLGTVTSKMGKYGVNKERSVWITSPQSFAQLALLDIIRTIDKVGVNAAVLTGELGRYEGSPVIVSPHLREDADSSGVSGGTTGTQTLSILKVSTPDFKLGVRRGITTETDREILFGRTLVVSTWRGDFQQMSPTADNSVGLLYNITKL